MRTKDTLSAYLMLLPFYVFFVTFVIFPIAFGMYFSFTRFTLQTPSMFIGLGNYIDLLHDEIFLISLKNTLVYSVSTILFSLFLGLVLANVLNSRAINLRSVFRTLIFIPYIPSMVSLSIVWLWLYDPSSGVFNNILHMIGLNTYQWLYDRNMSLGCIVVMSIWRYAGYVMIVYLAALQTIPASLFEAATMDGVGPIQRFLRITLPLLKPTTFFLIITLSIHSFSVFEQVYIMTDGGPFNSTTTIVHQIYSRAFTELRYGYGSAMATVLFIVVGTITFLNFRLGKEGYDVDVQ